MWITRVCPAGVRPEILLEFCDWVAPTDGIRMPQVKLGDDSSPFGRELRRLRTRRGLSLQKLAELVNYTRGYIGKVETGDKPPPAELARRCDDVLEAGGQLVALSTSMG